MPAQPTPWALNEPVSAKKLNTDLYTYVPGNAFTPNGILFHAQRPLLYEWLQGTAQTQPASTGGAFNAVTTNPPVSEWSEVWDSAAYYGPGMDTPGIYGQGMAHAQVLGADGLPELTLPTTTGALLGWMMVGGHYAMAKGNNSGTVGAGLAIPASATSPTPLLTNQLQSTVVDNCVFGLDLVQPAIAAGSPNGIAMGAQVTTTTGTTAIAYKPNATDWTGENIRLHAWWASVNAANGITVPAGPVVPPTYTTASAITSAALNADITNTLNFLNMPPLLRAQAYTTATSIPNLTVTTVPLVTGVSTDVDTYTGFSNTTHAYTVPVSGVYLVHGAVSWVASSSASFNRQTGLLVNSTQLWGPAYQTAVSGGLTISTITRLLDLNAGDTVLLNCQHNKGSADTLSNVASAPNRLVMQWMGALGTPSTLWTPPDTGFRWQAGTPGAQLPALFNAHIQNDLGFLIQKPYLLSYQNAAQTGFAGNSTDIIAMQSATGRIHASVGDNYSGWTSGTSNLYTAQRSGWYLVVAEYTIAILTGAASPYPIIAQVTADPYGTGSGGGQGSSTYWGQHICTTSGAMLPGATYVGLHYLRGPNAATGFTGDTIQPCAQVQPANGTSSNWGTAVTSATAVTGQESSFGLIWLGQ